MSVFSETEHLFSLIEGTSLKKVVLLLAELDLEKREEYDFYFCNMVVLDFGDVLLSVESCDIDSNYSIILTRIFKNKMNDMLMNSEKYGSGPKIILDSDCQKIQRLELDKINGHTLSFEFILDNDTRINIKSGNIIEENGKAKVVYDDEMLLVKIK